MLYPRTITSQIRESLTSDKIIIIYGPRQVGKTTLVKDILAAYHGKSRYYLCDDFDIQTLFQAQTANGLKNLIDGYDLVVFDEAQRVKNIGIKLKILHDLFPQTRIIATGSSSFDLANEINEPLTGRIIPYKLYPLAISELATSKDKMDLWLQREQLLLYGTYPDIYNLPLTQQPQALHTLVNQYLYKDILTYEKIKKSSMITSLLQLLALQIGSEISLSELGQKLGCSIITVDKYITILEQAFIVYRLKAFSKNIRNEITKGYKVYFRDLGVRNALIQNFSPLAMRNDVGGLWENFCITERLKTNAYQQRLAASYFWRTYQQQEIDYIEESDGSLSSYEFKRSPNKKAKIPKIFTDTYNQASLYKNVSFELINPDTYFPFVCGK